MTKNISSSNWEEINTAVENNLTNMKKTHIIPLNIAGNRKNSPVFLISRQSYFMILKIITKHSAFIINN